MWLWVLSQVCVSEHNREFEVPITTWSCCLDTLSGCSRKGDHAPPHPGQAVSSPLLFPTRLFRYEQQRRPLLPLTNSVSLGWDRRIGKSQLWPETTEQCFYLLYEDLFVSKFRLVEFKEGGNEVQLFLQKLLFLQLFIAKLEAWLHQSASKSGMQWGGCISFFRLVSFPFSNFLRNLARLNLHPLGLEPAILTLLTQHPTVLSPVLPPLLQVEMPIPA